MTRYIVGTERSQATLFPESLDNYITEDNPIIGIKFLWFYWPASIVSFMAAFISG